MKKTLVFGFALAFSITPLSAFAAVNSINGLTAADQSLVSPGPNGQNTMHMDIVTVGTDTHRFKWDGTPWRVDQGGTGWANFTPGALIYGNGASGLATTAPATAGQILQFNGTFPTWVSTSSLGIVAGSNGQIQYNNNGNLDAVPTLVYLGGPVTADTLLVPNVLRGFNAGNEYIEFNQGESTSRKGYADLEIVGSTAVGDLSEFPGGIFGGSIFSIAGDAYDSTGNAAHEAKIWAHGGTNTGSYKGGDIELWPGLGGENGRVKIINPQAVGPLGAAVLDTTLLEGVEETYKFPLSSGTFGLLEADQTWTGNNTFSKGTGATTTVTFGTPGDATSHACVNTKNTDGQDISFYFVGSSMVVENNACQ